MVNHPDRRDHRIQREDGVQHHDLQYHHPETGIPFTVTAIVLAVFQPLMQFSRRLKQQEDPAEQHDKVAPGKGEISDSNQRLRQGHHPGDHRQQPQAHHQRQRQADQSRFIALLRRQFVRQDGNKHQVVDTEHNLQNDKRQQASPD